ncbi:MAG: thioredoxin family protein [Pirellulales bacterium]|nr:thioredoxin family protein [Pirellulales bacterium]NLZ00296.1 thioredoxin family protein [Pirellulaceae bacterium]
MTTLGMAILIQAALIGAENQDASYSKAHRETAKTGRPMVVLVGAEWCPACVQMKQTVVPQLKKSEVFKQISYAEVDVDQERELGRQLTKGGPIPQLVMYRRTPLGWRLWRIIGGQSVHRVERFISNGLSAEAGSSSQTP